MVALYILLYGRHYIMRRHKGFTLIELLIVVAIIGILAAIAIPNFLQAQTRAKVSRAKADMRSITTAMESYAVDTNKYPENAWMADVGLIYQWRLTTPIDYLTSVPQDLFRVENPLDPDYTYFEYWRYSKDDGWLINGWSLRSMGPDRDLDFVSVLIPHIEDYYDPTNGTISNGDIIRFGGGASDSWFINN
jgi:type II secretion system protein G